MNDHDISLIITSLEFTREKFRVYSYPTLQMRREALNEVNHALASVRVLRDERRSA